MSIYLSKTVCKKCKYFGDLKQTVSPLIHTDKHTHECALTHTHTTLIDVVMSLLFLYNPYTCPDVTINIFETSMYKM